MIKMKNVGEILVTDLSQPGAQANAAVASWIAPFAGYIKTLIARLGAAGVTGSQTVDIQINGVSIGNAAPVITFATGVQTPTYTNPPLASKVAFNKGDIISSVITAVHTTPAKALAISMTVCRAKQPSLGYGQNPATETSIGVEAE